MVKERINWNVLYGGGEHLKIRFAEKSDIEIMAKKWKKHPDRQNAFYRSCFVLRLAAS